MNIENKILEGLREFTDKLESGEPIQATRVERCPECEGTRTCAATGGVCWRCEGLGVLRTEVTL